MADTISVIRTEKKYQISEIKKSSLLSGLSMTMRQDNFGESNGYLVRSLYFDSIYDDDLVDKIDGLEIRKKIRLRIYSPDQDQVKLEIKQKQGASQRKQSMWITRELAEQLIQGNYSGLLDTGTVLGAELYSILECGVYRPKCIVEYDRLAFMDETNHTRVTLDSNLCAGGNAEDFFAHDPLLIPVLNGTILEVKYNRFLLSHVKELVSQANTTETAVSKYVMCRQIIG